jgi:DNA-binding transcriptional ArsR family regulator
MSTRQDTAATASGGTEPDERSSQRDRLETLRESSRFDDGEEPGIDTALTVLKNRRRRDVLRYLRDNGRESTIGELAEVIAAAENEISRQALSSDQRKRVYIGLYQCHLPKMDDAGVVDFEKNRGNVELTDAAESLFDYLALEEQETEEEAGSDDADDRLPVAVLVSVPATLLIAGGLLVDLLAGGVPVGVLALCAVTATAVAGTGEYLQVRRPD